MNLRQLFRTHAEADEAPDTSPDHVETDTTELSEHELSPLHARPGAGRRRLFGLTGLLVLSAALGLWWMMREPAKPSFKGPSSDPLLTVRPMAHPGARPPAMPLEPEALRGSPRVGSAAAVTPEPRPAAGSEPAARPTYYTPLSPEPPEQRGSGRQAELAQMGWTLAVKDRETQLMAADAKKKEFEAVSKEAEARIEAAEARIKAIKRNPTLALGPQAGAASVGSGNVPPPFPVPPPGFPEAGRGALVIPPKGRELPPTPEYTPKASEIFVRLIDRSDATPEALVSVGPASYMVRIGDAIGSWRVAGIGPNGLWLAAPPHERVWRPLLAGREARPRTPGGAPGLSASPAAGNATGPPTFPGIGGPR